MTNSTILKVWSLCSGPSMKCSARRFPHRGPDVNHSLFSTRIYGPVRMTWVGGIWASSPPWGRGGGCLQTVRRLCLGSARGQRATAEEQWPKNAGVVGDAVPCGLGKTHEGRWSATNERSPPDGIFPQAQGTWEPKSWGGMFSV